MVYESGFTSRRSFSTRPVVTSYAVSYPTITTTSRVCKGSYPIHSTSSYDRGFRVISSPIRIMTSPARVATRLFRSPSPVRITRMTGTRVIAFPDHTSSYTYTTPTIYTSTYIPSIYKTPSVSPYIHRYISSYIPWTHDYTLPTSLYSTKAGHIYSRSLTPVRVTNSSVRIVPSYLKRTPPGYGDRALTNYLSNEPFTTFREETGRIRNKAQSLIRDLHTPVQRRSSSMTPFPVIGFEPTTDVAFDAYVARITNPVRHIAKEVHKMSIYPEIAHKVVDPELDPHRPSRKFSAPRPLEDPIDDEAKEKQRLRQQLLLTLNEEDLDIVELQKKMAQHADKAKRSEQKDLEEEVKHNLEESNECKTNELAALKAMKLEHLREKERQLQEEEEEMERLAEIEKEAEIVLKAAQEAHIQALEEEQKREEETRIEEKKQLAEETRLANEARLAEEAVLAETARLAEKVALSEKARLAEDAHQAAEAARYAEEANRLAEEQRIRQEEINKLAELQKQAEDEREAELARQAAELSELARQEAEIAAKELIFIQQIEKTEITAREPIVDEPVTPEVQQVQESSVEFQINSGDTSVDNAISEEESK